MSKLTNDIKQALTGKDVEPVSIFKSEKEKAESEITNILNDLNKKYGFQDIHIKLTKMDVSTDPKKPEIIYKATIGASI